jgi:hypothetical protein
MASAVAESLGRAGGDHYFAERCFGAIWVELILGRDSGAHLRELDSTERGHAGGCNPRLRDSTDLGCVRISVFAYIKYAIHLLTNQHSCSTGVTF